MTVSFWSDFKKRRNSTKRPSGSPAASYDCTLKEGTSVMKPEIRIKWSGSGSPVTYSYAVISSFGNRCYYVEDWSFEDRQWTAHLVEDVLGSFQTPIGLLSKYVIRKGNGASTDGAGVPDALFPAGFEHSDDALEVAISGWVGQPSSGGSYIVGVVGKDNQSLLSCGGAGYGVLDETNLGLLFTSAYTASENMWTGTPPTTVPEALWVVLQNGLKSITNPSEFLASAMWVPFSAPASSGYIYPTLGYMQTSAKMYPLSYTTMTFNAFISTTGFFGDGKELNLYCEPYCSYYLEFWPFGVFPVNGRTLVSPTTTGIQIDITVDLITGTARFEAYRSTSSHAIATGYKGAYLCGGSAKLGVDLPIGGAKANYAGGLGQIVGMVGAAAGASSGFGVAAALATGTVSTAQAISPTASSGGACTGFAGISPYIRLHKTRFIPAGIDYTELGKAHGQLATLATIPGFIQCWDGDFESNKATLAERQEISDYLTGGFFYE